MDDFVVWRKGKSPAEKRQFAEGHKNEAALSDFSDCGAPPQALEQAEPFFVHRVVAGRREKGLTQDALNHALSMPKGRINAIERGAAPSGAEKQRIVRFLDMK